jgi:hypothetical protein
LSADQAGSTINKLQRSISDFGAGLSTQVRAFERLGISFSDLENKSPLQQFQMVQAAISKMENPTLKAATAMEIFGRSGGDMLALFADGNAIDNAMVTVGSAADLLDKNATKFDRISDLLGSAGSKLQGFFVGIADVAADKILPALEKFNAIDFAAMGQNFAQNFDISKLLELLNSGLDVARENFETFMVDAMAKIADVFGEKMDEQLNELARKMDVLNLFIDKGEQEQNTLDMKAAGFFGGLTEEDRQKVFGKDDKIMGKPDGTETDGPIGKQKSAAEIRFQKALDALMKPAAVVAPVKQSTSESDLMEKELEEQRERVAKEVAFMNYEEAGPSASLKGSFEEAGPPSSLKNAPISPMQATAMKMSTAAGAGFTGLAGLHGMQLERMAGIGPGSNTTFARDRKRLGIASGLQTGGLGAVRKVGAKAEQRQQRKDDTVIGTNERLTTVNEKLEKQNEMLQEALN